MAITTATASTRSAKCKHKSIVAVVVAVGKLWEEKRRRGSDNKDSKSNQRDAVSITA
jgi:hypothetical protein